MNRLLAATALALSPLAAPAAAAACTFDEAVLGGLHEYESVVSPAARAPSSTSGW